MSEPRTLEQIEDSELARMFIYKNQESQDSSEAIISDLFVGEKKEFFEHNPTPSEELSKRLESENAQKATITQSLEKAIQQYHAKKKLLKKVKETFSLKIRKKGELMNMNIPFLGADYRYFYLYLTSYKKEIRNAWTEFNSFMEITFKSPGNFEKLKKFELKGAGILLGMLGFLLVARIFLRSWENVKAFSGHTAFFSDWLRSIVIISSVACLTLVFPYLILGIFYFININYLYQSKYFHYFILLSGFIASILFLVAFFNFLLFQSVQWLGNWGIVDISVKGTR